MKILITGNLGYVGPSVIRQLRMTDPNSELIGFDMGLFTQCFTGGYTAPEIDLDAQYYGDIRSFPPALLENVDAVINLAAISNDPMARNLKTLPIPSITLPQFLLLKCVKKRGCRTMYMPLAAVCMVLLVIFLKKRPTS